MGYWNKIRIDFPGHFQWMNDYEQRSGNTCLREETGVGRQTRPLFLADLDPDRGDYATEGAPECSLLCALAEMELA
jgi:hypothetical protein